MFFEYSCFLYGFIVDNWQQIADDIHIRVKHSNLQTKAETMKFETKKEAKNHLIAFMNEKAARKFSRLSNEAQNEHVKNAYEYSRLIGDLSYVEAYAEQLEFSL